MSKGDGTSEVNLPTDVTDRVEARLPYTEFDSVDEYVTFVLEETLAHVETEHEEEFAAADEAKVQERLKSLGYLNE